MKYFRNYSVVFFTFICSFIALQQANAQCQDWDWVEQAIGSGSPNLKEITNTVATDVNGNVIVAGHFTSSTVNFGAQILTKVSSKDAFIAKYDANGNALWARQSSGPGLAEIMDIATDASGNTFATGWFQFGNITFGGIILTKSTGISNRNIFIVKYDPNGNVLWARNGVVNSTSSNAQGNGVATDNSGNVYFTGSYSGGGSSDNITFGAIVTTFLGGASANSNIIMVKYNSSGTVQWVKNSAGGSEGHGVTVDATGKIYATGVYRMDANFGGIPLTNNGDQDIVVLRYDANGNVIWAKGIGGTTRDIGKRITTDASGNVFVAGNFLSGSLTFGSTVLTNASAADDIFVVKYDVNGTVVWANNEGGGGNDLAFGIAVDKDDDVYVGGFFTSTFILFNTVTINNSNPANSDGFLIKYDNNGIEKWAKGFATQIVGNLDRGSNIATNLLGDLFLTTSYEATSITLGGTTKNNSGSIDMVTARLPFVDEMAITLTPVHVNCFGDNTGSVTSSVTGGVLPYTYLWTNTSTNPNVTGLGAGNISVTVTDALGCQVSDNVTLTQPTQLVLSLQTTNVNCNGLSNGQLMVNVGGGSPGYSYLWSNTQTTPTITGLGPNTYTVVVTDFNGCKDSITGTITQPSPLSATFNTTNVSCFSLCDGQSTVNPSGGTSPYNFLWSNNDTGPTTTGLCPNTYNVTITDANLCVAVPNVTITQPSTLSVSVSTTPTKCGVQVGSATATPAGGTLPYIYSWNTGGFSNVESGLDQGFANVTVIDSNGCSVQGSAQVGFATDAVPICIISVDTSSTRNIITWERPVTTAVNDSFFVYREIGTNNYVKIGSVPYDSLTQFTDTTNGINPNITSYRYKVSILDSCGNEGTLSAFHQTIHLTVNVGAGSVINLAWSGYQGFSVVEYRILRDSTGTGIYEVIDSVGAGSFSLTDPTPPSSPFLDYIIEAVKGSSCSPTTGKANVSTSRSNRKKTTTASLPLPVADFSALNTVIAIGTTTDFFDLSLSNPASWEWVFQGGNPGTSTSATPTNIQYDTLGCYEVKLKVVNISGSDSIIKTCYISVQNPLGVESGFLPASTVKVYPNPVKNKLTIEFLDAEVKEHTVSIYNYRGDLVYSEQLFEKNVKLNLSDFSTGIYIFRFQSGENIEHKRISIIK